MTPRILSKTFLSIVAGAVAGIGLGCVISTSGGDDGECGSLLSNSHVTAGGDGCKCDAGYTWENADDPNDYDCDRIPGKPGECNQPNNVLDGNTCFCAGGYIWCDPNDANDYSCCLDPAQDAFSGTGNITDATDVTVSDTVAETGTETTDPTAADTTDTSDTNDTNDSGELPDPAQCTADTPDALFCSNTEAAGPEGSIYYTCVDGVWTEDNVTPDDACIFDLYSFSYGCVDDGNAITFVCGNGPGDVCSGDDGTCVDDDVINACIWGRVTEDSCATLCNTIGDDEGITYESGFCDPASDPPDCFCCDSGEKGCPV